MLSLKDAGHSPTTWQEFLERFWFLLGAQPTPGSGFLAPNTAAILRERHRAALAYGLRISRLLASGFLGKRPGSADGPAFAVLVIAQVYEVSGASHDQPACPSPGITQDDGHALSGLLHDEPSDQQRHGRSGREKS